MKQTAVEWLQNEIPSIGWENPYWKSRFQQAKEMEKQQQGYSEEEIMNALHSVELKYNRDFTKIYEGMLEYLKELKNK